MNSNLVVLLLKANECPFRVLSIREEDAIMVFMTNGLDESLHEGV